MEGMLARNPMRLTADDLLEIDVPDHVHAYELENGELVEVSQPSARHGRIAAQIAHLLLSWVEANGALGTVYVESGCVLELPYDPERVRGPDVWYLSRERIRELGGEPKRGWFRSAPDLAVEVDSPDRRPAVEARRIRDYLDGGVGLLWVIHTDAGSATMYRPDGSARLLRPSEALEGDPVLPGLCIPLTKLFPGSPQDG